MTGLLKTYGSIAIILFCSNHLALAQSVTSQGRSAGVCNLEGAGNFELICNNQRDNLQIQMSGDTGEELNDIAATFKTYKYVSASETDTPVISFAKIDDGVFAALIDKHGTYLRLVAIPKTFKIKTISLTNPPNTIETSGTFTAELSGLFNLKDTVSRVRSELVCSFKTVSCPKTKSM